MRRRLLGRVVRWLFIAAGLVLVIRFARSVEWSATWAAIRHASPWMLLLAAGINALTVLSRGVRWSILLRGIGVESLPLALRSAVIGSGLSNILPASGGDPVRVVFVARRAAVRKTRVLAALALDRLSDLTTYAGLLALAPLAAPLPTMLRRWQLPLTVGFAAVIATGAVAIRRTAREERRRGDRAIRADLTDTEHHGVRASLRRFAAALASLQSARCLVPALGLSVVGWVAQLLTYHLVARAAQFPATFTASAIAALAVNVSFLVQATPGNVGVVQLIYALVMAGFGLDRHAAIGVAVLIQAVQILPVTAVALVLAPDMVRKAKEIRLES